MYIQDVVPLSILLDVVHPVILRLTLSLLILG